MGRNLVCFFSLAFAFPVVAQTSASIYSVSYQAPKVVQVAPGQVLHLTLHGLTTTFDSTQVATTVPLPSNFSGLSITLQRTGASQPELLPLLRGEGSGVSCNGSLAAAILAPADVLPCVDGDATYDIWAQIPFDMAPNTVAADNFGCSSFPCTTRHLNDAVLTVNEKSGTGKSVRLFPVLDQVHLLNSCTDRIGPVGLQGSGSVYATYPCVAAIAHGDGSYVTATKPAKPGEELVAYAYGLGAPAALFPTASATPAAGVPLNQPFTISFTGVATQAGASPDYVGLVGGAAGLYQVNFHVPSVPADLGPCTLPPSLMQLSTNPFNLTITLLGTASQDQASFCVQP